MKFNLATWKLHRFRRGQGHDVWAMNIQRPGCIWIKTWMQWSTLIYKKSFQNIVFDCFSNVSSQTDGNLHVFCHKGSKSFQNIAFDSVFVMFPVKHTVIYTFFAITSVQNTCFCSVFNALASKNPANLAMYNVFFIFGRFSIAGKLPKWPKIPFQYPLALRHPKILEKCRKHHRILVSVRNRFWAPPS